MPSKEMAFERIYLNRNMRKLFIYLCALGGILALFPNQTWANQIPIPHTSVANNSEQHSQAEDLIRQVAAQFTRLGDYTVYFVVRADQASVSGSYGVAGESYWLRLGEAEVFCDGKARYEVDHDRREVTINPVQHQAHNLLDNPVHAFEFLCEEFDVVLKDQTPLEAILILKPKAGRSMSETQITVRVDRRTMRPKTMIYDYDGEQVEVQILKVEKRNQPLKKFPQEGFRQYETIDFRP